MCGRCAVITEREVCECVANTRTWRRNGERISKKYNMAPHDRYNFLPVILPKRSSREAAPAGAAAGGGGAAPAVEGAANPAAGGGSGSCGAGLELAGMRWGLIPKFAKEEKHSSTFNCRAENLQSSGMWNRCLKPGSRCKSIFLLY